MSTTPRTGNNPTPTGRGWAALARHRSGRLVLTVLVLAGLATATYALWFRGNGAPAALALTEAMRGPLVISLAESGTIQNRGRAVVKSEVEGSATILFLVKEGTYVRKGDLLLELDASRLKDDLAQQQITVMNSEAAFIRARENLAVTKSQADSDIAKAELTFKFAQQDLVKYAEGEHPRELQQAEANINIAKEELQRTTDKLEWSKRLAQEGYITRTELQADELSAKRSQIDLELAVSALELIKKYTHQRNQDQRQSDVDQAREALDRSKRKAAADLIQAEADLKAKDSEFGRQKTKMEKITDQIAKCRILSPVDGMVVYATTGQGGRNRNTEPMDEGQQVRERQDLIYLPTDAFMTADIKIHESSLRKVRRGLPVKVTVEALPGQVFWGRVGKIGLLPDAQSAFMNPDLKVYTTQIEIDPEGENATLRTGMSCRAEVLVEQYADALYVPVQSVVRVGEQSVVYVPTEQGPKARPVVVGLDNNRMIHVLDGLKDGEKVLLAPPLAPSAAGSEPLRQTAALVAIPKSLGSAPANGPTSRPGGSGAMRNMSPEERQRYLESLTPEQREALRQRGGSRGDRGGTPRPPRPEEP